MLRTMGPVACEARTAASRPLPGPFTKTSTWRRPCSIARRAAPSAAIWAAYGVLLREPLKPDWPALAHERTLPCGSVSVINVLLNVDCTYARPRGTDLRSRLRPLLFVVAFRSAMRLLCARVNGASRARFPRGPYFFAAALR